MSKKQYIFGHLAVLHYNAVASRATVYLIREAVGCVLLFPVGAALRIIPCTISWDTAHAQQ